MGKIRIEITKCRCERCGHEWIPRRTNEPKVCPKCKSPYWNTPRKREVIQHRKIKNHKREDKKGKL